MHDINHDLRIKTDGDSFFQAITAPSGLNNWWTLEASGQPELHSTYDLFFGDGFDWCGQVIVCEENQAFAWKMTKADADWEDTIVGFRWDEDQGFVNVSFYHHHWRSCNAHFRQSSFCWAMYLHGLQQYLENGRIIPYEQRGGG